MPASTPAARSACRCFRSARPSRWTRSLPWRLLDSLLAPAPRAERVGWLKGVEYAHRGLHGGAIVENSPRAFEAAIARGMGIECDVQQTADGQAAVFHDWELDRLTAASGAVAGQTASQLAGIALAR